MAVQYIPSGPSTPLPLPSVRRSLRHIALPPTPSTTTPPPLTRRKRRQSPATPSSITPPSTSRTDTPRTRKRARLEDDPEQRDLSPPTTSPLKRLPTLLASVTPITPEPTPRSIRAQKRRRLIDEAATESEPTSSFPFTSSSSLSLSLSPTTPQPQPVSPEPISPSHPAVSTYIVKSKSNSKSKSQIEPIPRSRKRKAQSMDDDTASSSTGSGSDSSPTVGDPLPRSLAKRRKLDTRSVRVRSKSQLPTPSPSTPKKRTSASSRQRPRARASRRVNAPSPRGGDKSHNRRYPETLVVRRSPRLLVHNTNEKSHPSDAQLEESIPMSPLTPPPSDDESDTHLDSAPEVPSSSDSKDPVEDDEEEEDDSEMEMIASINVPSTLSLPRPWKSIIPSHISNPVLNGRPPPNPAVYAQLQLASYKRTKPNTPSPLSLYSYTGAVTPPTSPGLLATSINSLDAIDDIPPLGEAAAVEAIEAVADGEPVLQLYHEQPYYGQGYAQETRQPDQAFEHQLQPQPEYQQPAPAVESVTQPTHLVDLMMMDLRFLDQMGFMLTGNTTEGASENQNIPTTVHMQDVHLHQGGHHERQTAGQQQHQILDVHQPYAGYPFFSTEQQGQDSAQLYGTQPSITYGGETHHFQPQPQQFQQPQERQQFQSDYHQPVYSSPHHHQEEPRADVSCEPYGRMQAYEIESSSSSSGLYQEQPNENPAQQDFQVRQQQQLPQGDDVTPPPFPDPTMNGVSTYHQTETQGASPSSAVVGPATSAVDAVAAAAPQYSLSMNDALVYLQQTLARFHEEQVLVAHDAAEMHARQLEEFQREKEERKTRLKRTKLVREVQVVPMGSSMVGASGLPMNFGGAAGRARGLWAVACKARMFEIVRIYKPALIREVTEMTAREHFRKMGLAYPSSRVAYPRYRRRMRKRGEDLSSMSEDDRLGDHEPDETDGEGEGGDLFDKKDEADGDMDSNGDGEEFRNETIFDFELFDDDEECVEDEMVDEVGMQIGEEEDEEEEEEDGDGDGMDEDDDEAEDDDDGSQDNDEDGPDGEVDLDLEARTDPLFQPDLSMRITPQEPTSSTTGGIETTFYLPPVEMYAVCEQKQDQDQDPDPAQSSSLETMRRVLYVQRPALSLPPPSLSVFRPASLKYYNIDPMHAGRGTPCVKERREVWAGGPLVSLSSSFSGKEPSREEEEEEEDASGGLPSSDATASDAYDSATWYAYADGGQVAIAKQTSDAESSAPSPANDSVFGDCVGTCCMGENGKGKAAATVDVCDKEGGGGGGGGSSEGNLDEELPRGEEEACGDDNRSSPASTNLLQPPIAQPPLSPPPPIRPLAVDILPAPDRIPHGRRGVMGRTELLKPYAPPNRSSPSILPLSRRPPRPRQPHMYHHSVVPYSWEPVADAMDVLAFQGIDASVWVDGHGRPPPPPPMSVGVGAGSLVNGISGTEAQQVQPQPQPTPMFNPSSSELSAALG